jgi:hypothetical protein
LLEKGVFATALIWINVCHREQDELVDQKRSIAQMTYRQMSGIVIGQKPTRLHPSATVQEACRQMQARRIGVILGVMNRNGFSGSSPAEMRLECSPRPRTRSDGAAGCMTRDPDTLPPGKTAIDALRLMQDGGSGMCRL